MATPETTTLQISLHPSAQQRQDLRELLQAFQRGCDLVSSVAAKKGIRHQATLHALVYDDLCPSTNAALPLGERPLPSQYAVRVISRVSHRLRLQAQASAQGKVARDPYPRASFDVDGRLLSFDLRSGALYLSTLDSWGQRGSAARGLRTRIPADLAPMERRLLVTAAILGGSLTVPAKGPVALTLRVEPGALHLSSDDIEAKLHGEPSEAALPASSAGSSSPRPAQRTSPGRSPKKHHP